MVVVNPNQVAILHFLRDSLCKKTVGFLVGFPGGLVEGDLAGVVMEQGPEDGVYRKERDISVYSRGLAGRSLSTDWRTHCSVDLPGHHQ